MLNLKENDLVFIKKDVPFTTSLIISHGSNISHDKIKRIIEKHIDRLKKFGKLYKTNVIDSYNRDINVEIYNLNEPQATFLITLLKNTDKVLDFKENLVVEFYKAKKLLLEKQTAEYKRIRFDDIIHQKEQMKKLDSGINEKSKIKYIKANTIADKAISMKYGYKKSLKKGEMNAEMINERKKILEQITSLMVAKSLGVDIPHISEIIYNNLLEKR